MAPLRGWGPQGKKAAGQGPFGHWNTSTFIPALRHDRVNAPRVVDSPADGDVFRAYAELVPVPTLRPGDVVVMGNLGSHKVKEVRKAVRSVGARPLFLPPLQSPDLDLIKQAFGKLKRRMRKA